MNIEQARELLPWYATGSLDASEAQLVAEQVAESEELARELEELRLFHDAVVEEGAEEPEFRPQLIEDALQRIDQFEAAANAADESLHTGTIETSGTVETDRKVVSLDTTRKRPQQKGRLAQIVQWQTTPVFARAAMIGQIALIGILAAAVLKAPEDQVSTTLSGPVASVSVPGWQIMFADSITEREMRDFLQSRNLVIVDGPSALGLYTVALKESPRANGDSQPNLTDDPLVQYAAPVVAP